MVEIIAHRGARSLAPENTLAAARLAHCLGAARWETDVNLTRDGRLVLFHDATLTRCTNAPAVLGYDPDQPGNSPGAGAFSRDPAGAPDRLDTYTLTDLAILDAGSYFEATDPFLTIGEIDPTDLAAFKGEAIPTLYQGLVLTRDLDWQINVELKDYGNEPELYYTAAQTIAEISRAGINPERIVVSSFNHQWLRWFRDRMPDIEVQALVGSHDHVPLDFSAPIFTTDEFMVLNINAKLISAAQVRGLKARGRTVNLFTVNDPGDYIRFVNAGADGIITDFPQRFIR